MIGDAKLLALLVHRGVLRPEIARAAILVEAPGRWLAEQGFCTEQQWSEWQRTEGGTRPVLSRYELGPLLGEGGMARVFRAVDRTDGSTVALKVLRPEMSKDKTQVERFVREARLLLEIDHPHVVKGLRVAREGEVMFFAMEELPGRCLQDVLADEGRLDEESALEVVLEVAQALDVLHGRGLVHRDVKPGTVMWSEERGAVLIDLGFAVGSGAAGGAAAATNAGETTAGTVHYIAPEQARGSEELDVRADIYALGATLYHLVTGSLPFEGKTSEEVLAKQVLESLSGQHIRDLALSPQLHYFLEKMMAKDREIRFQDPQQLQVEVRAFVEQRRVQRELEEQAERNRPRLGGGGGGSGGGSGSGASRASSKRSSLAARRKNRRRWR